MMSGHLRYFCRDYVWKKLLLSYIWQNTWSSHKIFFLNGDEEFCIVGVFALIGIIFKLYSLSAVLHVQEGIGKQKKRYGHISNSMNSIQTVVLFNTLKI